MEIVVIAESAHDDLTLPTLECVAEARAVAGALNATVHALLPGADVAGLVDRLAAYGADKITLVEHPALAQFSADGWLAALAGQIGAPFLLLAPDSGHTRAWLPRLALRRSVPLVSGCIQIQAGSEGLTFIRPTHGGARHEHQGCPGAATVFATLVPGACGLEASRQARRAEIVRVMPPLEPAGFRDRTLRTLPPDPRTVDLSEAERIVAGGLGIGAAEAVAQLQQLADQLGAALGGTRVIADRGWIPADRFIGTTGKIVAPKLYLALGISGASQHVSGMSNSQTVVVVNNDRTAPMFGLADLGIVGDLHQILPQLLAQLETANHSQQPNQATTAATLVELAKG